MCTQQATHTAHRRAFPLLQMTPTYPAIFVDLVRGFDNELGGEQRGKRTSEATRLCVIALSNGMLTGVDRREALLLQMHQRRETASVRAPVSISYSLLNTAAAYTTCEKREPWTSRGFIHIITLSLDANKFRCVVPGPHFVVFIRGRGVSLARLYTSYSRGKASSSTYKMKESQNLFLL